MTLLLRPGEKSNVFYRLEINKSCWYRNHFSFFLMVNCVWPARSFSVFLGDETKLARPAAYDFEFRKIIFSYFFIVTAIQEEVLPPPPLSFLSLFLGLVDLISHCFWISSISCLHSSPPFLFFKKSHFSHSTPTLPPSLFSLSLVLFWSATFPLQLIKFHRVGRGSEGGSTHMSDHSMLF